MKNSTEFIICFGAMEYHATYFYTFYEDISIQKHQSAEIQIVKHNCGFVSERNVGAHQKNYLFDLSLYRICTILKCISNV